MLVHFPQSLKKKLLPNIVTFSQKTFFFLKTLVFNKARFLAPCISYIDDTTNGDG